MTDVSNRLRVLLQNCFDKSGLGQSTLAKYLGISPSAISRMLSGERQISAVELLGIRDFFSLSFSDVERALDLQINNDADLLIIAHDRLRERDYLSNVHISSYDEDKSGISIPDFLLNSVKISRNDYLRWLRIFDDAMAPTVNRGDVVIIDCSNKGAIGLFVLETGPDQLSVRRLDGRWESEDLVVHVAADNPKFRSYEAPLVGLKVVGQVLAKLTTDL